MWNSSNEQIRQFVQLNPDSDTAALVGYAIDNYGLYPGDQVPNNSPARHDLNMGMWLNNFAGVGSTFYGGGDQVYIPEASWLGSHARIDVSSPDGTWHRGLTAYDLPTILFLIVRGGTAYDLAAGAAPLQVSMSAAGEVYLDGVYLGLADTVPPPPPPPPPVYAPFAGSSEVSDIQADGDNPASGIQVSAGGGGFPLTFLGFAAAGFFLFRKRRRR